MLDISRRARDELREMDESPGGRIVVGMPPRVALGLSTPLIQRFRERFPRAVITVLEGLSVALRESLIAGKLDLALLFDPAASPQLAFQPLMREKLLLVAPPRASCRRGSAWRRWPTTRWCCRVRRTRFAICSTPCSVRAASSFRCSRRSGRSAPCLRSLQTGVGCTILPESALGASGDEACRAHPSGRRASGMRWSSRPRWRVRRHV